MPGILSGTSSPKGIRAQDLIARICCSATPYKGIHLIDLQEFYIDRGMLTVDDIMFKYEVLDDWQFSEDLCEMYLRHESCAPSAPHESPARNRGASMSRAASSPYLDGKRNFSINFSRSSSYHNRTLHCLSRDISINTMEQSPSPIPTISTRPTDYRRSGDQSLRARFKQHRSLSSDRTDEWNPADNDDMMGTSHRAHPYADSKGPLRVTTTQQQRTLQVQGALLQNLMGTLDSNYARLLSEEKGSNRVEWSLTNESNRMCEIYIEKNRSIESSSPMLLATLKSWDSVDLQSKQQQEQSIITLRMIQLMQQQQDDIKQMVLEQMNQQQNNRSTHTDIKAEHQKGNHTSNIDKFVTSPYPQPSIDPQTPSQAKNSNPRSVSPSDILEAEQNTTNKTLHTGPELSISLNDLKISELNSIIQKLENDLNSQQHIINMQDVLIRAQQSLLLKMQIANTT